MSDELAPALVQTDFPGFDARRFVGATPGTAVEQDPAHQEVSDYLSRLMRNQGNATATIIGSQRANLADSDNPYFLPGYSTPSSDEKTDTRPKTSNGTGSEGDRAVGGQAGDPADPNLQPQPLVEGKAPIPMPGAVRLLAPDHTAFTKGRLEVIIKYPDNRAPGLVQAAQYVWQNFDTIKAVSSDSDAKADTLTSSEVTLLADLIEANGKHDKEISAAKFLQEHWNELDLSRDGSIEPGDIDRYGNAHPDDSSLLMDVRSAFGSLKDSVDDRSAGQKLLKWIDMGGDETNVSREDLTTVLASSYKSKELADLYVDSELTRKDVGWMMLGGVVGLGVSYYFTRGAKLSLLSRARTIGGGGIVGATVGKETADYFLIDGVKDYYEQTGRTAIDRLLLSPGVETATAARH